MAKGNGNTRSSTPASPKGLTSGGIDDNMLFAESRNEYLSYDSDIWQRTLFNEETGGYVVTEKLRIPADNAHPNAKEVFAKEQEMCKDLAGFGLGVKHLYERTGVASPDIEVARGGHSIVEINGKTADLKALKNSNNIRKQAIDTFETKKKAELIVFKFSEHDRKIPHEIEKLQKKGWHGIYYYADSKTKYEF